MRLIKIKYRNPALDTEQCYCINNYLWNKSKVQIINNGKEMLVPKYYSPIHVGALPARKKADARYRARQPLKLIKQTHEQQKKERKKRRKTGRKTERIYKFMVNVSYDEYKVLWNFLYKELRDPLKDRYRIQTIEELEEKRLLKENENQLRKNKEYDS